MSAKRIYQGWVEVINLRIYTENYTNLEGRYNWKICIVAIV